MTLQPARRRVTLLRSDVAERIAAGEVVERPASVIKELVENALDAGSTRVWVEIHDGGQGLMRVTDNGCGMARDDANLALSRFATSKIACWEDMESLVTLGFRGEALPSILAVSRLEILTREAEATVGTRIVARGGEPPVVEEAGCPEGTRITVTDLFFNTPARKKFLKSAPAETGRIADLLGRLALVRTDVHFRLTTRGLDAERGREIFNFPAQYGLADRACRLWNLPPEPGLRPMAGSVGNIAVSGVIGLPPLFAPTRSRQAFYVNGRLITSSSLQVALSQGFGPLLADRRFPVAVVLLEMPPDWVDVNIHPTKAEVRFLRPHEVFRAVRDSVAAALEREAAAPQDGAEAVLRALRPAAPAWPAPPTRPEARSTAAQPTSRGGSVDATPFPPRERPNAEQVEAAMRAAQPLLPLGEAGLEEGTSEGTPRPVAHLVPPGVASGWQVLAQLERTYILCMRGDTLVIVDQHTAHERIHYEALGYLSDTARAASQPLLFPILLDLAADEAGGLQANLEIFASLGYEIEPFGGTTFVVRAVPSGLDSLSRPDVLRRIVAEVVAADAPQEPARLRERLRATTACRASVMAGDALTREEMQILLARLDEVAHSRYCPHGRPVSVRLSPDDLARLFGRR